MVSSNHHSEDGTSLPRWELEGKPSQVLGIRKGRKTPSVAGGDCRDRCPCGCFGPRNGRDRLSACVQEDGWPVEVVLNHPVAGIDALVVEDAPDRAGLRLDAGNHLLVGYRVDVGAVQPGFAQTGSFGRSLNEDEIAVVEALMRCCRLMLCAFLVIAPGCILLEASGSCHPCHAQRIRAPMNAAP